MIDNAKCLCGNEYQDLNHILFQCSLYDEKKITWIKNLADEDMYLPLSIRLLISEAKPLQSKIFVQFLKACKLSIYNMKIINLLLI